jgi:hypothetical protein
MAPSPEGIWVARLPDVARLGPQRTFLLHYNSQPSRGFSSYKTFSLFMPTHTRPLDSAKVGSYEKNRDSTNKGFFRRYNPPMLAKRLPISSG